MNNQWIEKVKKYSKDNKCSYKQALIRCSKKYKKDDIKGSGIYQTLINKIFKKKGRKDALDPSETHAIGYNREGNLDVMSYMGPGTNLIRRLKENVDPKSEADKISQTHDIRYHLANNAQDIKNADLRMLSKLSEARKQGKEGKWNYFIASSGIKAKRFLEDNVGIPPTFFTSIGHDPNEKTEDTEIVKKKLKELEAEGYGLSSRKRIARVNRMRKMNIMKEREMLRV